MDSFLHNSNYVLLTYKATFHNQQKKKNALS